MKTSIGTRLYWSVMALFLVFAVAFIIFQQHREKEFKIETLNTGLQDFNRQLHLQGRDSTGAFPLPETGDEVHRVTVTDARGNVLYDNLNADYRHMPNHADRKEIRQALETGQGYDINRLSSTLNKDYFYSATYFPEDSIVIRTALPYDNNLAASLKADQHYIWFSLVMMLVLSVILRRFTNRLGDNITKLRIFATRAAQNESLETEELIQFPNDELGETAERIVRIYKRVKETQEQQDRLKRQLTQNVAHELRTPVASIQGYIETLMANPDADATVKARFLDRCHAQTRRLAALVEDISTINRMDEDGRHEMQPVCLTEIVNTVARETALQMEERGMRLNNEIREDIIIKGDAQLLYGIFRNLTDNAIAYAGQGTTVTVTAERHGDAWYFRFCDNGAGVPEEHLARLFERFYRVDKGRSRKTGGTGLGLSIVKNAVRLHGGSISVSNLQTGGLCFDFSLKTGD